jgi:hypothetical protein
MNETKTTKIKQEVTKIDAEKINDYSEKYPNSKTLRRIINYRQRVLDSNDDQEIFRLSVDLAYYLDTIVNKVAYVKNEEEKKYWLAISEELFRNTKGVRK